MIYLLITSLLWGLSFGIIKHNLDGVDPFVASFIRMFISALVFLPFFRLKNLSCSLSIKLVIIGMIQYGLMYIVYFYSFKYLHSYEVALLTTTTPIYVSLIYFALTRQRPTSILLAVALAVVGGGIIFYTKVNSANFITGCVLVQISNICFALGQIWYKKIYQNLSTPPKQHQVFVLLYTGAMLLALLPVIPNLSSSIRLLTSKQIAIFIYLGAIPSGLCFYLWNYGATRVYAHTLAIFNNLKTPIAILCSIIIFRESHDFLRLSIGTAVMLGALVFTKNSSN